MKTRVISGVIIAAAVIVLGVIGGPALAVVLLVCSTIGFYEMTGVLGVHGSEGRKWIVPELLCEIAAVIYYAVLIRLGETETGTDFINVTNNLALITLLAVFLVNMTVYVLTFPRYKADEIVRCVFAFLYVPLLMSCIYKARFLPNGLFVYALVFLCSWICDTCAYAVGMKFGKHKMAPVLSPKKTVEGALGGIAGSAVFCLAAGVVADIIYPGTHLELPFLIIGVVGSLISMVGDLAASAIKRDHGIKDYGKIIPGHGGIMDRFDSAVFTAPVIYYLAVLLLTESGLLR